MKKILGWTRREIHSKGADPTVFVEWSKGGWVITEFQNVYTVKLGVVQLGEVGLCEDLHRALELAYDHAQETVTSTEGIDTSIQSILELLGIPLMPTELEVPGLSLDDVIRQLLQLRQLLAAQGRDPQTVNVYARGKRVTDIRPEDDGSGQDNLDVWLS